MTKRRTHSSIDRLPKGIADGLRLMLVDDVWPDDFAGHPDGVPRYCDAVTYCRLRGFSISESAIGRYGKRMRMLARMKQAGVIVRDVMSDLRDDKASETQKAVAEMITAEIIELVSSKESLTAKEIMNVARAVKDCGAIGIEADKYIRKQVQRRAAEADKKIKEIGTKKKIDPETLKAIREQVYGIVD